MQVDVRPTCLVVTIEAPWPAQTGGRARTAAIVSQLADVYDVTVIYPTEGDDPHPLVPKGVSLRPVLAELKPKLTDRLSVLPRLGKMTLRAIGTELKKALTELEPECVYWSHSYLGAAGMRTSSRLINLVEFANIEGERSLSISRSSRRIENRVSALAEYIKSIWWEPRCARQADLSVALHHADASKLQQYGASVVLVPNGYSPYRFEYSDTRSRQIFAMGSWDYAPNRTGIESFLNNEWGEILHRNPDLQLVIAGKGSHELLAGQVHSVRNTRALGFVDDLSNLFDNCFCFLAPASTGGGSQLKIAEALSHHRIVVGPRFLHREVTPEMPANAIIASADLVTAITDLARSPERRHLIEDQLRAFIAGRTWQKNFTPIHAWLSRATSISGTKGNR